MWAFPVPTGRNVLYWIILVFLPCSNYTMTCSATGCVLVHCKMLIHHPCTKTQVAFSLYKYLSDHIHPPTSKPPKSISLLHQGPQCHFPAMSFPELSSELQYWDGLSNVIAKYFFFFFWCCAEYGGGHCLFLLFVSCPESFHSQLLRASSLPLSKLS